MKKLYFLFLFFPGLLLSQNYTSYLTGNHEDVMTTPQFGVCLMGGASESDDAMRWFLERADGGDILVLRASGSDGYNNYLYSQLGVTVNSVETLVIHNQAGALEPYVLQKVAQAEAIWFAGGDQWNYVNYFRNNAMEDALNHHINVKQAVIGGTSAGMAILGSTYFSAANGTVTSAVALNNPYDFRVSLGHDDFLQVPFLEHVVTDTHYDNPDRRGRHTAFMARMATDLGVRPFGIASEEYTAVCIDADGNAIVFGEYPNFQDYAYFIQGVCYDDFLPETCETGTPLTWYRDGEAVKVYKVPGTTDGIYSFNLNHWESGEGGTWENWYVQNSSFFAAEGDPFDCDFVGVEDFEKIPFQIYPNPFVNQIQIATETSLRYHIYNLQGKLLNTGTTAMASVIDTTNWKSGMYFLQVHAEGFQKSYKLVKR
jgi:cyanophycinase-like exopeptidase